MPTGIYKRTKGHKRKIALSQMREKNSFYGKHHNKKSIEKIRIESLTNANIKATQFKKGQKAKNWNGFKKGSIPHNYKGGVNPLNIMIRTLNEYKKWRSIIFERDNYTCQTCGKRGGNLEAHHNKKFFAQILAEFLETYNQFNPIKDKKILLKLATTYQPFWDINNGLTLCEDCHKALRPIRR